MFAWLVAVAVVGFLTGADTQYHGLDLAGSQSRDVAAGKQLPVEPSLCFKVLILVFLMESLSLDLFDHSGDLAQVLLVMGRNLLLLAGGDDLLNFCPVLSIPDDS